jgi:hypothetical protein
MAFPAVGYVNVCARVFVGLSAGTGYDFNCNVVVVCVCVCWHQVAESSIFVVCVLGGVCVGGTRKNTTGFYGESPKV